MSRNPLTRDVPMWDVVVEAHEVIARRLNGEPDGRTYSIERKESRVGGSGMTESMAKALVLKWAHIDAGVPPWRPYLRESWKHVRVSRYMEQIV